MSMTDEERDRMDAAYAAHKSGTCDSRTQRCTYCEARIHESYAAEYRRGLVDAAKAVCVDCKRDTTLVPSAPARGAWMHVHEDGEDPVEDGYYDCDAAPIHDLIFKLDTKNG